MSEKDTIGVKTAEFFKRYIFDIIIAISCISYIFWGIITIEESGKSILDILASSIVSLGMGTSISMLLGQKGMLSGFQNDNYLKTISLYGIIVERITNRIDKLDDWCIIKVNDITKRKQIKILSKARIKYETFISEDFDLKKYDKQQIKLINKALNVKVFGISSSNLLSDNEIDDETERKEITITKFKTRSFTQGLILKIIFSITFSYFVVDSISSLNLANIIWSVAQICVWLLFGILQYYSYYSFITTRYRNVIIRKINYLEEFNLWTNKEE
jgi:hypothetical protein